MFDVLTYEKGCGVLRMLEQHIGPEVFRDGVRTYLKAHAYGNTVTSDLWDALEDASGAPVRDVMDTFILQGGHPLVSLHGDTLSQQPFALGPGPRRRHVVHRVGVARARRGAGAARRRRAGRAGAPPRPRCRARARSPRPGRAWPWSTPAAGACSGSATRPHTGTALAEHLPELTPAGAGQPAGRHLGDHPRRPLDARRSSSSWPRGSATSPSPPPGPRSAARCVLTKRIASPEHEDALHEAVAALDRAHPPPAGLRRHAGRERPHADAARARHQPHGHGRRRRRGPGRGGAALRRLAHRRRLGRSDPARHRVGHAGRRVAAPAARRLRRAAGALPDAPRRPRRRCARSARSPGSPTSTCASAPSTWP